MVPLVASFGSDVIVDEPAELRGAIRQHHLDALKAYDVPAHEGEPSVDANYRNDDSRLRSTRGRNPRSVRD
jgi:hypothetical protein